MADTNMRGWNRLKCDCGSDTFLRVIHLKWSLNGGCVDEPAFYQCAHCQGLVDQQSLIKRAEVAAKRADLKEKEDELEVLSHATAKRDDVPIQTGNKDKVGVPAR